MKTSLSHKGYALWPLKFLPLLCLLSLNVLTLEFSPFALPLFPLLGLVLLFHWTIYRPDLMSPLGLLFIALTSNLLLSAEASFILSLLYLVSYAVILRYRHLLYGQRFYKIWGAYALYSGISTLLYWTTKAIFEGLLYSPSLLFTTWLMGILIYPLFTSLLASFQRWIPLR